MGRGWRLKYKPEGNGMMKNCTCFLLNNINIRMAVWKFYFFVVKWMILTLITNDAIPPSAMEKTRGNAIIILRNLTHIEKPGNGIASVASNSAILNHHLWN